MSVAKDTSWSIAAAVVPVAVLLALTPFYLDIVGADRFGILAICWTILGAASFASLGMGPALTYRLSMMDGDAPAERSSHVWMALLISLIGSGLIAALALAFGTPLFERVASLPPGLKRELGSALPMMISLLPLGAISGVLNGALQGRRRFDALSSIAILNSASAAVSPLAAALLIGVELPVLALTLLSATLLVLIVQLAMCIRIVPLSFSPRLGRNKLNGLLSYGAWMSVTALVAPFLLLFDRFVVGGILGPAAVGVYVLAFNLLQGLILVPASLSKAVLPRLAPLSTEQEVQELQSSTLGWLNSLLTPTAIAAVAVAPPFFHFWIGPELGRLASPVAAILLVGGWLHGIGHIPSTIASGRSRPDLLAKLLLACLLPYLLLLYLATERSGLIGAAAVWTLRAAMDPILFLHTRPRASDMQRLGASVLLVLGAMTVALALPWVGGIYWVLMVLLFAAACYQNRAWLISSVGEFRALAFRAS